MNMAKRVLSVGQCGPDHGSISRYLDQEFACEGVAADLLVDTQTKLEREKFDLILVNRKLDHDYSDGLEIIRALKANPATANVPIMLVTNYPEHQEAAMAAGALLGFGKLEFEKAETREKLAAVLET